jgi:hypothetical protein
MAINKDYIKPSESSTEHVNVDSEAVEKKKSTKETKREEWTAIESKNNPIAQEAIAPSKNIPNKPLPVSSSQLRKSSIKDDNSSYTTNIQKKIETDKKVAESVVEAVEKTVEEVIENVTDLKEPEYMKNYEIPTSNPFVSAVTFWQTNVLNYLDIYKELSINTIRLTESWFSYFFPKMYPWSRLNQ